MDSEHFARRLTWRDGFALALVIPLAIFATAAPVIAAIGTLGVILLYAVCGTVTLAQNRLFAEMATMFPDKAGGITMFANEAWKRRCAPLGVLASYGYWAAWSFGMGVFALSFGSLVQSQFFADATWSVDLGSADVGVGHVVGLGALVASTILNVRGIEFTIGLNKILGGVALLMIAVVVVGPFVTGDFDASGLTYGLNAEGLDWGGWRVALVFLFLFGWTVYGTEVCATIAPEYRDPKRDVSKALMASAALTLVVAVLVPIGLGGTVGDAAIAADPDAALVAAFHDVIGSGASVVTLVLAATMLMILNVSGANAARALYGIADDGMGPTQLAHLNRHGQPSRAIFVGFVANALLLLFVGSVLGIIFASNIGAFVAITLSLCGFVLLRIDRPHAERPINVGRLGIPLAVALAIYTLGLLIVGFFSPANAGYGGRTEQIIGLAVLVLPLLLWAYRRVVQDKLPLSLTVSEPSQARPLRRPEKVDAERSAPYSERRLPGPQ
jgi:amino acid transporter